MRRILAPLLLALALLPGPLAADKRMGLEAADLTNVFLGPEHSLWLVGAVSWMASREEVAQYLSLKDEAAAERFIEEFWRRRDAGSDLAGERPHKLFEERSAEADKLYREAGQPGRRTARGTIYVLYGSPAEVRYELGARPLEGSREVWVYPKGTAEGLDGKRPERNYRFSREGDLTVFYRKPVAPRLGQL